MSTWNSLVHVELACPRGICSARRLVCHSPRASVHASPRSSTLARPPPQQRFVTHLDDAALESLTKAYRCLLAGFPNAPATPSVEPVVILDTCSSWLSYLPDDQLAPSCRVVVQGLNRAEVPACAASNQMCCCASFPTEPRLPPWPWWRWCA